MRLLIVDNGTKHLPGLLEITAKHDVTVVTPDKLSVADIDSYAERYNAAILSGSYEHAVLTESEFYQAEIQLVKSGKMPLLGICLGFELICYSFGAQLSLEAEKIQGAGHIIPTDDGARIFQGTDPIRVTEAHRWCVEELPKGLLVLARSETGIEAVKHKLLPIYGLQFHPEDFTYSSDGKLVFDNILSAFDKR